jgi:hypothetical protein
MRPENSSSRSQILAYLQHDKSEIRAKYYVCIEGDGWMELVKDRVQSCWTARFGYQNHHHRNYHFQIALFKRYTSLEDSTGLRPSGFHFFGFLNNNSFKEQARQPCVQPPTWRTTFLYLCPPVTGWPSYTPRQREPLSSPSTTRKATVKLFQFASSRELLPECC